jgi:hypothetical protein
LRDAAKAFETTDSLRQQIIDRRVGPNEVANLERAEVIAQLASVFYGDFNPGITQPSSVQFPPTPPPPPGPSPNVKSSGSNSQVSLTANSTEQDAYTAYNSCVAKFSPQGCYNAVSGPEESLVGSIASQNACAFASDYWLPTVTAIGMVYGSSMSPQLPGAPTASPSPVPSPGQMKEAKSSSVPAQATPTASPTPWPGLDDIKKAKFSSVPNC